MRSPGRDAQRQERLDSVGLASSDLADGVRDGPCMKILRVPT
jgi:hypothetical protein